jgi:hypothetical protein
MQSDEYKEAYATDFRDAVQQSAGLRARLRGAARSASLSLLGSLTYIPQRVFLRCLYCHYVFDDQTVLFERMLERLKAFGTFISTDRLISVLDGTSPFDQPYFHLSFDDGFRNNFLNALPVLRKLKIPAIFFVPSAMIDASYEHVRNYCLTRVSLKMPIETLRWDDLKAIRDAGYEIGSHTRTHARFSEISSNSEKMRDEILGSKEDLERGLNQPCKYISWPYGRGRDADEKSLAFTSLAGYEACFSAIRGSVMPAKTNRFRLPRHHVEAHWPMSHVRYFASGSGDPALCD